jgi:pyruvate formate lyase activating enzyme
VARAGGKILLPRIPLIPGITDTVENISGIAGFLRSLGVNKAALMAYNPLWHEKCAKIGARDPLGTDRLMSSWPAQERMVRCKKILSREGIES